MSRKFKIGGSSKSLKDLWKEKKAAAASLKTNDGKWNNISSLSSSSDDDYKNYKFKVNNKGEMEPVLSDADIGADDIVFGASKSNLRRMADLERNVSILANQIKTIDGDAEIDDDSDELFDNWITKDTAFTKDVTLGRSGSTSWWTGTTTSRVDIDGHLYINNGMSLGSTAQEVFRDLAGGMASTGLTFSDSGDSISINESYTATRSYVDTAIANLSDSAPGTLNTLNELAAALGDDANFASTTATNIAAKVSTGSAEYLKGATVSNDTITFTKGDGSTFAITTTDANTQNAVTGLSFASSTGVLTLTQGSGGTKTIDLDGRWTDNGYADTMNQHVRTTDSPTFANVTATAFNGTATYAKYADLAERYAADAPYAEGTVVVFGGEAEVTASSAFAQRSVAGVVSLRPAVAMNAEAGNNETHPFIALQGRVPVKVTGDVKKGDILVASDVAGTATAWTNEDADPRMTAYVGIAIADAVDGFVEVKVGK